MWDSAQNVAIAWNCMVDKLDDVDIHFTAEDIHNVMGQTMDAIAAKFFCNVDAKRQMEIMDICSNYENEYLSMHGGVLYEGLEETLNILCKDYRLFIVSNCQSGYIEAFLDYYGFEKYFRDILCWGDNELSKGDNIKLIMERNNIENAVYVGDTQGDCDSTYYAGAKFIHAAYGFGSVNKSDAVINSITDLVNIKSL